MFIQMPIHGLKEEVKMEIRVQSLKFDADQKLLEFVEKKVSKIGRIVAFGETGKQECETYGPRSGRFPGYREKCTNIRNSCQ